MIDPISGMQYSILGLALIVGAATAVVVLLGLVIDLRFVVLFGDLGLKVGVTVQTVYQVDGIRNEAGQIRAGKCREDGQRDVEGQVCADGSAPCAVRIWMAIMRPSANARRRPLQSPSNPRRNCRRSRPLPCRSRRA